MEEPPAFKACVMNQNTRGESAFLLGFDAREMFIPANSAWDAGRRDLYLLRRDAHKPLSVDPMVWPSLFGDGLPDHESRRLGPDALHLPEWKGTNQGLWDDLSQLRASLRPLGSQEHRTVAVSLIAAEGDSEWPASARPYREPRTLPKPSSEWRSLGFDVADGEFTSGLSNCGYRRGEVEALRRTWARDLNEHHLFTDVERALAFRDLSDRRVPEHAPFFVYALSLVESP